MIFLIAISLILHLFTFFWIIILMHKINVQSSSSNDYEKIKAEIEDILISYTEEMKDENEKLLVQIKKMKEENEKLKFHQEQASAIPRQTPLFPNNKQEEKEEKEKQYEHYRPPEIPDQPMEDLFEQSDTLKILTLAKQGLSAEQIAKKLNLGKGEVELVLKFYHS